MSDELKAFCVFPYPDPGSSGRIRWTSTVSPVWIIRSAGLVIGPFKKSTINILIIGLATVPGLAS